MGIEFLEPWVATGEYGDNLVEELRKEVSERHLMWNRKVRPIGQRTDADDVLFEIEGQVPCYAVVHLTWSGESEESPHSPETRLFASLADWIESGMLADHREFIGEARS
ncbi:MAG: hypothetical protein WCH39_19045 [Schlesneria sp.]